MRILQLHCDSIEYTPTKKEIRSAEDIDDPKTIKLEELVVVFVAIEDGDGSSVAQNATNVVEQDKYSLTGGAGSSDKGQTGISSVTASAVASSSASGPMDGPYGHPPSAKEVSKSLSNAMSGGKLVGPTAANDVGGYDPRKSGSGYSSRPVPPPGAGGMVDMKNDALVYHNPQQNSFNSSYNKQQQSSYGVQQQYSSQNQYGGGPNQSGSYGSSGIVQ